MDNKYSPEKHHRRYDRDFRDGNSGTDRMAKESKYDEPPHSRLFIVCGKQITEEDFVETFSKYGTIEEIWMVRDRNTDEPKGVTYIKFSKTSEAALAMEEMNGRCIKNHPRPLKVLIAHSRDQGSKREQNEEERLLRLFVVVPKTMTEGELRDHFKEFGDIDYASIVRDRGSKESKGFGYVKYHRMSHAALAFESCDRQYKPVFADPKPQKTEGGGDGRGGNYRMDMGRGNDGRGGGERGGGGDGPFMPPPHHGGFDAISCMETSGLNPEGVTRLTVYASAGLNQDQLWKLFDLVPGLDYCDVRKDRVGGQSRAVATVVYSSPQAATYAREKLHGFEYPPGQRLIVKFDGPYHDGQGPQASLMSGGGGNTSLMGISRGLVSALTPHNGSPPGASGGLGGGASGALAQLAESVSQLVQASSLLQAAGLAQTGASSAASSHSINHPSNNPVASEIYDPSYCSVKLPPPQPLAPVDSAVSQRLFIVCYPSPPPLYAMKDVFGRFGNLIDIYMLNGKSYGYAKYSATESAVKAISILHGQEVMGSRMKVMEADPHVEKSDSTRKRIRIDDQ